MTPIIVIQREAKFDLSASVGIVGNHKLKRRNTREETVRVLVNYTVCSVLYSHLKV